MFRNGSLFRNLVAVVACLNLTACSTAGNITYQNQKEVLQETVSNYPSRVEVEFLEARMADDRINYLLKNELSLTVQKSGPNSEGVKSWISGTENYVIRIAKKTSNQGVHYSVDVSPRTAEYATQAELNASNIARFIKQGTFEKTLFKR